jgi:iron complex transport system permease protein
MKVTKKYSPLAASLTIVALSFLASVAIGPILIPPKTLVAILASKLPGVAIDPYWPESFNTILFSVRLPHAVLIMITGAALGGSGAAYQGVFRNPLADPYLIGVASGAGLGAIAALSIKWPSSLWGMYTVPMAAFVGALVAVAAVYSVARLGNTLPTTSLILAGVAISSFSTALTSFLMLRSNHELRRALGWLLGGGMLSGWDPVLAALPYVVIGLLILVASGHALNVLQFGEEQATQLGLPAEKVKAGLILAASMTTAAAVAFSGIIGFIGLIVPHVVRIFCGPDYRKLIPLSISGGVSALLIADLIARNLLSPQVLPVGIVTALAGAPFFLWVLRRHKNQTFW